MNELMNRYLVNFAFVLSLIVKILKVVFGLCLWVGAIEVYDRVVKIVVLKVVVLRVVEVEYNEVMV